MLARWMKIRWRRGNSEFTAFAIISVALCSIFLLMAGLFQLIGVSGDFQKTIETIARAVAVCRYSDDAQDYAEQIAALAVNGNDHISNVSVDIEYEDWDPGETVVVTVSGTVTTWIPTVNNRQLSESAVVTLEYNRSTVGSVTENAAGIAEVLLDCGLGKTQVAAILGNLSQELSTMDPTYNRNGVIGIAQWTTEGRKQQLLSLEDPFSIETQAGFIFYELEHGQWMWPNYTGNRAYSSTYRISYNQWKNLGEDDLELATAAFCANYERCYYYNSHLEDVRIPQAEYYLEWLNENF